MSWLVTEDLLQYAKMNRTVLLMKSGRFFIQPQPQPQPLDNNLQLKFIKTFKTKD